MSILSFSSFWLELFFLILSVTVFVFIKRRRNQRLPPGPWTLPLIGYKPFLGNYPHKTFKELAKKYGPVLGIGIGTRFVVVLNDFESAVDAFRQEASTGRPQGTFYNFSEFPHVEDMIGPEWKEHRKSLSGFLRNLYRDDLEDNLRNILSSELERMVISIRKVEKKPSVNLRTILRVATNNVIFKYIFGHPISPDDPFCEAATDQIWGMLKLSVIDDVSICFPELLWLWRRIFSTQRKLKSDSQKVDQFISEEIKRHKETFDPNNLRDFIDHSLLKEKTSQNGSFYCDETLNSNLQLIQLAGSDTTRSSLEWMFVVMVKFPEIQDKVFQEINGILGFDAKPNWEDRDKLLYTMATVMECQRWKTSVPLSTTRRALKDFNVRGYIVPKDSLITVNQWAIHNDESYWNKPSEFNPGRYLTKDGRVNSSERFFPFSYGKRDCPGKKQAMMELFLFLVTILQKFKIHPSVDGVSLEENHDLVVGPKYPFVRFESRTKA